MVPGGGGRREERCPVWAARAVVAAGRGTPARARIPKRSSCRSNGQEGYSLPRSRRCRRCGRCSSRRRRASRARDASEIFASYGFRGSDAGPSSIAEENSRCGRASLARDLLRKIRRKPERREGGEGERKAESRAAAGRSPRISPSAAPAPLPKARKLQKPMSPRIR